MSCGIYKITNKINNKVYIGQSINIESRWVHHRNYNINHSHYALYQAFDKYGLENFIFEIIELCPQNQLNDREIYWINYYNSYQNGYNSTTGGQGNNNNCIKLSIEDIEIIYDLLLHSNISQRDIAKQFNVGEDTISEINQGKTRINPKLTYPLRQNHKEHKCLICGKDIYYSSTYCPTCANIQKRQVNRPDRETLKSDIRTNSFIALGQKYGVSDNGIRKWCKYYNLPYKKKDIKAISDIDWESI